MSDNINVKQERWDEVRMEQEMDLSGYNDIKYFWRLVVTTWKFYAL